MRLVEPERDVCMTDNFSVQFWSLSHRGRVRRGNEDALRVRDERRIAAIADGIGGSRFGEVASQLAVDACQEYLANIVIENLAKKATRELTNAIGYANETIIALQQNDAKFRNMGSTLTCFYIDQHHVHFAWVGDSRIYVVNPVNQEIRRLTHDHTLQAQKIDPQIAPNLHKRASSILTQHVGSILLLSPESASFSLKAGDIILACTDGLTDRIEDPLILQHVIDYESDMQACAASLLDRALDRGGQDNISLILAQAVFG